MTKFILTMNTQGQQNLTLSDLRQRLNAAKQGLLTARTKDQRKYAQRQVDQINGLIGTLNASGRKPPKKIT